MRWPFTRTSVRILLTLHEEGELHVSEMIRRGISPSVYKDELDRLSKLGLVLVKKKGKRKVVVLTELGVKVAYLFEILLRELNPHHQIQSVYTNKQYKNIS